MSHQSLRSLEYYFPRDLNTRAVFNETVETGETKKGVMIAKAPRSYLPTLELMPGSF